MREFPPEHKFIDEDNLLYLIYIIYKASLQYKEDYFPHKKHGFIPFHSRFLKNVIPEYLECLKYLQDVGVVDCDNDWAKGAYSKGYRINERYDSSEYQQCSFQRSKLYFKLSEIYSEQREFQDYWKRKRFYLYKPFQNKCLSIDFDEAYAELKSIEEQKLEVVRLEKTPLKAKGEKLKSIIRAYRKQESVLRLIQNNDFQIFQLNTDDTSQRFHTPIVRLNKDLRKYIRIDGERTVTIDLKNSQPYFFLLFFRKAFWNRTNRGENEIRINKINSEYRDYIVSNININKYVIPYMLPTSSQSPDNQVPQNLHFCKLIAEGKLYEYMVEYYAKDIHSYKKMSFAEQRKIMKRKMIMLLYDIPRKLQGFNKFFATKFGSIVDFLNILKSFKTGIPRKIRNGYKQAVSNKGNREIYHFKEVDGGFSMLAIILQKIESYCFLDVICRTIYKRFPDLNFLTIHDSIVVPESKAAEVKSIMEQELLILTRVYPILDVE